MAVTLFSAQQHREQAAYLRQFPAPGTGPFHQGENQWPLLNLRVAHFVRPLNWGMASEIRRP